METEYHKSEHYILIKTFEDLNKVRLIEMIQKSAESARNNKCTNLLFDHRGCRLEMKLTDLFNITADVKVLGLTTEYKCAIIYDVDGEKYKFSEDVINSRFNPECRFFDNYDQGKDWLLSE